VEDGLAVYSISKFETVQAKEISCAISSKEMTTCHKPLAQHKSGVFSYQPTAFQSI
jgi:hypothetical protein